MRMDKSWRQCMTISQMQAARQKGGGTLSTRHVAAGAKGAQKRRKVQESRKPREVMSQFKPADLTGLTPGQEYATPPCVCAAAAAVLSRYREP